MLTRALTGSGGGSGNIVEGTFEANSASAVTVPLPFMPKLLIVYKDGNTTYDMALLYYDKGSQSGSARSYNAGGSRTGDYIPFTTTGTNQRIQQVTSSSFTFGGFSSSSWYGTWKYLCMS